MPNSSHQRTNNVRLPGANSGLAKSEPAPGLTTLPDEPTKKFFKKASPFGIEQFVWVVLHVSRLLLQLSCMSLQSLGVYHMRFGGEPFAADMNEAVFVVLLSTMFELWYRL